MRIMLTGAGGFIGSHLEATLDVEHDFFPVDPKLNFATTDFTELLRAVQHFQPECVVHLGANPSTSVSLREPYTDFHFNALGTVNLCETLRQSGCHAPLIFTSTVKVYPGYDEDIAPLGLSKQIAETYIKEYAKTAGFEYVINRPSTVYGPGQNGTSECGWVSAFVEAARVEQTIVVRGDGTQSRDILYIEDFVALLADQITNTRAYRNATYDVGGGAENEVSLNEMLLHLGHKKTRSAPRMRGDLQRVVTDNEKISQANGWKPLVHWREGVERMMA